mgnify:CR=1 FL=1
MYFLRRCHVSTAEPTSCAAPFRRFDSAILAVSSGTTTAGSIVARSSRKEPHETHAKAIVQHVDGAQQAQQHVVERQQLDAMYLAGTFGAI